MIYMHTFYIRKAYSDTKQPPHFWLNKEIPNIFIKASNMLFKMSAKEEEILEHFGFYSCLSFPKLV